MACSKYEGLQIPMACSHYERTLETASLSIQNAGCTPSKLPLTFLVKETMSLQTDVLHGESGERLEVICVFIILSELAERSNRYLSAQGLKCYVCLPVTISEQNSLSLTQST